MREIVLDTETTGLDPNKGDRLVEIGCIELLNRIPTGATFHAYLNPDRDMPAEAFAIHGLSIEFLKTHKRFADVVDDFLAFIGNDAPLVIPTGMAQRAAAQPRLGKAITSAPRSRASGALRVRASWSLSHLSALRSWRRSASCWATTWIACLTIGMSAVSASLAIRHPLFPTQASDKLAVEVVQ